MRIPKKWIFSARSGQCCGSIAIQETIGSSRTLVFNDPGKPGDGLLRVLHPGV